MALDALNATAVGNIKVLCGSAPSIMPTKAVGSMPAALDILADANRDAHDKLCHPVAVWESGQAVVREVLLKMGDSLMKILPSNSTHYGAIHSLVEDVRLNSMKQTKTPLQVMESFTTELSMILRDVASMKRLETEQEEKERSEANAKAAADLPMMLMALISKQAAAPAHAPARSAAVPAGHMASGHAAARSVGGRLPEPAYQWVKRNVHGPAKNQEACFVHARHLSGHGYACTAPACHRFHYGTKEAMQAACPEEIRQLFN